MPRRSSISPSTKQPHYRVHGDNRAEVPGVFVDNTFNNSTGTAVTLQPNVSTLLALKRDERTSLVITVDNRTGTADMWLACGHNAGVNKGLGPLTSHGSHADMDLTGSGVFPGEVYGIQNGTGPLNVCVWEAWQEAE